MSDRVVREETAADLDVAAFAERYYADWSEGVRTNMVMSIDGSVSFRGRVGPLSSATDRALFHALRALSDVVLVGAATARIENYGPVALSDELAALRARDRRPWATESPRMAIVSLSCSLPERSLDLPPEQRPILITSASADTSAVRDKAEMIAVGEDGIDLPAAIEELRKRGLRRINCEGGPSLLNTLTEADLIDELCLTMAPQLTAEGDPATESAAAVLSPLEAPRRFRLKHALVHDDDLFLRYMR
ncbi:pyrimidine reductase family protein [Gordonia jinghuaiqii]|uniref:Pyrimidine reductase family protein n=1 Tax=Gordonia jinghuaiqii TaxID=2758710 RepID=A0A7D7QWG1_9ACTN|nr:pyrimidine reductase family protein [Gordonia jinghuaiqii]MCR5976866.1 pyrimidine reductase family protein [Gordonia jinghuaiqii]QMT00508.1 pyrimidine reductase family protein [Gordonia jinghuaiqii]